MRRRLRGITLIFCFITLIRIIYIIVEKTWSREPFKTRSSTRMSSSNQTSPPPPLCCDQFGSTCNRDRLMLLGRLPTERRELTIGLPTLLRDGARRLFYLPATLNSLMDAVIFEKRNSLFFLIYIADDSPSNQALILQNINNTFADRINEGLLGVMTAPTGWFPSNKMLPQSFRNDSYNRRVWRSKQNLDYNFMMKFARGISKYYLHMEDDVEVSSNFLSVVRMHLQDCVGHPWQVLSFYPQLSFIGLLFRDQYLSMYARFLYTVRAELPCDMLLFALHRLETGGMNGITACENSEGVIRELIKHVGIISSSKGT